MSTARRHALATVALVLSVACKERSNDSVTKDPEARKKATPAPSATDDASNGLAIAMTPGPHLAYRGRIARLGMKSTELEVALGAPTWSTDYGSDEGAMSNTKYLNYAKLGVAVRTKSGEVEGFYVYLRPEEIDGRAIGPARVALPEGLDVDATIERVEQAVGAPTNREVVESMDWIDLVYDRADARVKFHFEKNVFTSVALETVGL